MSKVLSGKLGFTTFYTKYLYKKIKTISFIKIELLHEDKVKLVFSFMKIFLKPPYLTIKFASFYLLTYNSRLIDFRF
jgi:hypothetical protein